MEIKCIDMTICSLKLKSYSFFFFFTVLFHIIFNSKYIFVKKDARLLDTVGSWQLKKKKLVNFETHLCGNVYGPRPRRRSRASRHRPRTCTDARGHETR